MSDGTQPVVVLDPGHGGATKIGGSSPNNARGPNGLLEKDLTLDIATRTASALASSAQVILTRTRDVNLSLADRAAVARNNSADVFVSIHLNGFSDPNVDGTEVWVARGAGNDSVALAQEVLNDLVGVTRASNRGIRRSDMGVLLPSRHASRTAACLAEVAFLTNPAEAAQLANDSYRQQIAQALATAVIARIRVPVTVGGSPSASPGSQSLGLSDFIINRMAQYFRNATSPDTPLDPGAGGVCIDQSALQMGDIIVSTTDHLSSRGIRFGTGSEVSHAKLYIGAGQVVEAVGQGVVLRSLDQSLADDTVAVAFRYPGITQQQQLMVRDYAGQQLDRSYNYVGIVRQALFQVEASNCDALPDDLKQVCRRWVGRIVLAPGNNGTFFCSELVLGAFANAGIALTANPPSWSTPQDIVDIALSATLAYVGHLKAPPAASQAMATAIGGAVGANDTDQRRLAIGIGGFGSGTAPSTKAFDVVTLAYGVAGGQITDGFYRDQTEKQALTGRSVGRAKHLGIDVSTSNGHGGGAEDARRGLPVYAAISPTIDIASLNSVRASRNDDQLSGLGIPGQGTATLREAIVLRQPWRSQDDSAYGGVVGLACRYTYSKSDGSPGVFTLYIEYLHLITPDFLPKDGNGNVISTDTWAATGKGIGFGPRIQDRHQLTAADLTAGDPVLVGYLGATQFPHVHIQAAYGDGEHLYLRTPRFDPTVMIRASATTTQAWSLAAPMLTLSDTSFSYDVAGTVPALTQPSPNACWATVATMLISWRDQASYPISAVCDMGGSNFRSIFDADTGLPRDQKPAFLAKLPLCEEPPANYLPDAYLRMLQSYGALWVTTDVGNSGNVAIHARVMTGIYGDGSPDNTFVWLIDPADGQRHNESFRHFAATFEQIARDVGANEPLWVQVVHNPPPGGRCP
jgi:N-acetylmuramoyl-L-alanine amidase/uncharacterized protein YycO